jgi:hypothetical protein
LIVRETAVISGAICVYVEGRDKSNSSAARGLIPRVRLLLVIAIHNCIMGAKEANTLLLSDLPGDITPGLLVG